MELRRFIISFVYNKNENIRKYIEFGLWSIQLAYMHGSFLQNFVRVDYLKSRKTSMGTLVIKKHQNAGSDLLIVDIHFASSKSTDWDCIDQYFWNEGGDAVDLTLVNRLFHRSLAESYTTIQFSAMYFKFSTSLWPQTVPKIPQYEIFIWWQFGNFDKLINSICILFYLSYLIWWSKSNDIYFFTF